MTQAHSIKQFLASPKNYTTLNLKNSETGDIDLTKSQKLTAITAYAA